MLFLIYNDLAYNEDFKNFSFSFGDNYVSWCHKYCREGYSRTLLYFDETRKEYCLSKPTTKLVDVRGGDWLPKSIHDAVAFDTIEEYIPEKTSYQDIMPKIYPVLKFIDKTFEVRHECEESYKNIVEMLEKEKEKAKNLILFKLKSEGIIDET